MSLRCSTGVWSESPTDRRVLNTWLVQPGVKFEPVTGRPGAPRPPWNDGWAEPASLRPVYRRGGSRRRVNLIESLKWRGREEVEWTWQRRLDCLPSLYRVGRDGIWSLSFWRGNARFKKRGQRWLMHSMMKCLLRFIPFHKSLKFMAAAQNVPSTFYRLVNNLTKLKLDWSNIAC